MNVLGAFLVEKQARDEYAGGPPQDGEDQLPFGHQIDVEWKRIAVQHCELTRGLAVPDRQLLLKTSKPAVDLELETSAASFVLQLEKGRHYVDVDAGAQHLGVSR